MKGILVSTTTILAALLCYSSLTFATLLPVQGNVQLDIQNQTHGDLTITKTTLTNLINQGHTFSPGTTIVNSDHIFLSQQVKGTDNTNVSFTLKTHQGGSCSFMVQLVNGKWALNPKDCSGDLLPTVAMVNSNNLNDGLVRFNIKSIV